ncbi:hypothetical protein HMPREF0765_1563 [Sphingobacterium spiritivorum ATCC 33300]|uniref:Uncharacterized protein n=1 Tax=Sphingobacterium spiritivorum ATCC 33300 TaxID=525372 RepID=C2FW57_SPHSI|nr:hypothetical protein HMPREF0765_1563 [Sphingobacterium spiritivorum ATCC 33300]
MYIILYDLNTANFRNMRINLLYSCSIYVYHYLKLLKKIP